MKPLIRLAGVLLALACPQVGAQEHVPDHGDLLHARDRTEWEAGGLYEGRYADGTPFQIELAYGEPDGLPTAARGLMEHAYWEPRGFAGTVRSLVATKGPAGTLALSVKAASGAEAREWFALTLAPDRLTGKGSWSAASSKERAFTLRRIAPYRAVALTRPAPEAQEAGSDEQFTFTALFPVLGEQAVDAWIRDAAGACDASIDCRNQVKLRWHSPDLVALGAGAWHYNFHAAHGNYTSTMRHYALGSGTPVLTRFSAFVAAGNACRDQVSAALVAKLGAQGLSWPEQGALDVFKEPKFIPTPTGIEFHWDPYEVGSFAQGIASVFLTRAELGSCAISLPRYD